MNLLTKKLILFASGNGSNVENIIKYFKNNPSIKIVLIAGNNKNAFVFERAKSHNIQTLIVDKLFFKKEFINNIKKYNADLIILAGFLWKVPGYLIKKFPDKIINIHPALLPKYGGKGMYGNNVHNAVLKNKEKTTGITIHLVNREYDKGEIIFQAETKVDSFDDVQSLIKKVQVLEKKYFPRVIEEYLLKN